MRLMMPKTDPRSICFVMAFLLAIFTTTTALAESPADINEHLLWSESTGVDGLSTNLPKVDTRLFIQRIVELQANLLRHASNLEIEAEEKELGVGDAIIAAIMPGGLIYAGIRQNDCDQTRTALAEIRTMFDELSRDILAYQYATGSVVFAQLN